MLLDIQNMLIKKDLKALIVRSTDKYFNEYVPSFLSIRQAITGFSGSVGDAIIFADKKPILFVDGRYSIQAKEQVKDFEIYVCSTGQSIEGAWLETLESNLNNDDAICYDPRTMNLELFHKLDTMSKKRRANVVAIDKDMKKLLNSSLNTDNSASYQLETVPFEICGQSTEDKIAQTKDILEHKGINGFLLTKLDDISWLLNLRSYSFPYQSSIPGIACLIGDTVIVGLNQIIKLEQKTRPNITLVKEENFFTELGKIFNNQDFILGIDSLSTSKYHETALRALDIKLKQVNNPVEQVKAIKNDEELLHLREAFRKADQVVDKTRAFVEQSFDEKKQITEKDVDHHLRHTFEESGAKGLSFTPICASGKNGAVIHYSTPNPIQAIKENSLFLLDTGAYYQGGYATDLTRTFLAGSKQAVASKEQKEIFTLVLKASINGLAARLRKGALGAELDAIVRAPLWQKGLDFAHGTGHGVGINVHEFPPRIGPGSLTKLVVGQVFSIEPGLYIEGFGGVRIENLATIVKDPESDNFIRVQPLTFSPLDERLIDQTMLNKDEEIFLDYYKDEWKNNNPWPNLPPLKRVTFYP